METEIAPARSGARRSLPTWSTVFMALFSGLVLTACATEPRAESRAEGPWASTSTRAVAGQQIEIRVIDPARASQTVSVEITCSDAKAGLANCVQIELDELGKGCARYLVPMIDGSLELSLDGRSPHHVFVHEP